jgi:hypothetical protein
MVGTPYHNVCPASFFIPLKGLENLEAKVIDRQSKNEFIACAAFL